MKEAFLLQNQRKQNENKNFEFQNFSGYTSSIQKAMKESIVWEKNSLASSSFQTIDKFFAKKIFTKNKY